MRACVLGGAAGASAAVSSDSSGAYGRAPVKDGCCHPAKCLRTVRIAEPHEHHEDEEGTAEHQRHAHLFPHCGTAAL